MKRGSYRTSPNSKEFASPFSSHCLRVVLQTAPSIRSVPDSSTVETVARQSGQHCHVSSDLKHNAGTPG
jgi:hypothetical protein